MNSVTSWLKSWSSDGQPPEKPEHLVVAESLLIELDFQIQEAELILREREQEEKRQQTGVDYSWLVTKPPKGYDVPELEKLELEELCMKVKAVECGRVINSFRDALLSEPCVQDIPKIFRAVIIQILDIRPKDDTMSEWMMKSLKNLRKTSSINKVMPVNIDNEITNHPQSSGEIYSQRRSSIEDINKPVFTRVEDLPV